MHLFSTCFQFLIKQKAVNVARSKRFEIKNVFPVGLNAIIIAMGMISFISSTPINHTRRPNHLQMRKSSHSFYDCHVGVGIEKSAIAKFLLSYLKLRRNMRTLIMANQRRRRGETMECHKRGETWIMHSSHCGSATFLSEYRENFLQFSFLCPFFL